jgi:hypothetical protein
MMTTPELPPDLLRALDLCRATQEALLRDMLTHGVAVQHNGVRVAPEELRP